MLKFVNHDAPIITEEQDEGTTGRTAEEHPKRFMREWREPDSWAKYLLK